MIPYHGYESPALVHGHAHHPHHPHHPAYPGNNNTVEQEVPKYARYVNIVYLRIYVHTVMLRFNR